MVLQLREPGTPMAKDTTPSSGRTVKYRVLERAFVNGVMVEPKDGEEVFVMSTPGQHGGPLEQVDPPFEPAEAAKPSAPKPPPKPPAKA